MFWGKLLCQYFCFCLESLVRDNLHYKDSSKMHSGSLSQMTSSCKRPFVLHSLPCLIKPSAKYSKALHLQLATTSVIRVPSQRICSKNQSIRRLSHSLASVLLVRLRLSCHRWPLVCSAAGHLFPWFGHFPSHLGVWSTAEAKEWPLQGSPHNQTFEKQACKNLVYLQWNLTATTYITV